MTELAQTRSPTWERAAIGVILALVLTLSWQIHTFVTGQDPFFYIHLARTLLETPLGSAEWRHALFRVAPGFPLLLALSIGLGGDFAPYVVNPLLGLVFVLLCARLLRHWFDRPEQRVLALLGIVALLFAGQGRSPHFLLYPFRGLLGYTLVLAGYLWVERAATDAHPRRAALVAGGMLVAAALVREPLAIAIAAAAGWLLVRHRPWAAGYVATPLWVALAVVGVGEALAGAGVSFQADVVWRKLTHPSAAFAGVESMTSHLVGALGGCGVCGLLCGIWGCRRDARAWLLHLLPAAVLFGFYAWFGSHPRYAISVVFFLCPVVVRGWVVVLERLACRGRRVVYGLFISLMWLWLVGSIMALSPWGPRVTADQIRMLQRELPTDGALYTEGMARYLTDAVVSYSDLEVGGHARSAAGRMARGVPCYFAKPLNDAAVYRPIQSYYPLSTEAYLRHRWDIVPIAGTPDLVLGTGMYALGRLEPFAETTVRLDVATRPGTTRVIWLDLKESGVRAKGQVRVRDVAGRMLLDVPWVRGPSLRALVVPGKRIAGDKVILEIESDRPVPRQPIHAVHHLAQPQAFDLGWGRIGSSTPWFVVSPSSSFSDTRYVALGPGRGRGRLRLPPVLGGAVVMEVLLSAEPTEEACGLTIHHQGLTIPVATSRGAGGQAYYAFHLPPGAREPNGLDVFATGRQQLTRIRFTFTDTAPRNRP